MLKYIFFLILFSAPSFASIRVIDRWIPGFVEFTRLLSEQGDMILWYGGERGLVPEGTEFYRPLLEDPRRQAQLVLYDLFAWAALRGGLPDFQAIAGWAWRSFADQNAQSLPSAYFFSDLRDLADPMRAVVSEILERDEPYEASLGRPVERAIRGLLVDAELDWLPNRLLDASSGAAYSALQYVEALLLVRRLVLQAASIGNTLAHIMFALPNDELRYYDRWVFGIDLLRLLNSDPVLSLATMTVQVTFAAFRYGQELGDRPYIARRPS